MHTTHTLNESVFYDMYIYDYCVWVRTVAWTILVECTTCLSINIWHAYTILKVLKKIKCPDLSPYTDLYSHMEILCFNKRRNYSAWNEKLQLCIRQTMKVFQFLRRKTTTYKLSRDFVDDYVRFKCNPFVRFIRNDNLESEVPLF